MFTMCAGKITNTESQFHVLKLPPNSKRMLAKVASFFSAGKGTKYHELRFLLFLYYLIDDN